MSLFRRADLCLASAPAATTTPVKTVLSHHHAAGQRAVRIAATLMRLIVHSQLSHYACHLAHAGLKQISQTMTNVRRGGVSTASPASNRLVFPAEQLNRTLVYAWIIRRFVPRQDQPQRRFEGCAIVYPAGWGYRSSFGAEQQTTRASIGAPLRDSGSYGARKSLLGFRRGFRRGHNRPIHTETAMHGSFTSLSSDLQNIYTNFHSIMAILRHHIWVLIGSISGPEFDFRARRRDSARANVEVPIGFVPRKNSCSGWHGFDVGPIALNRLNMLEG